MCLRASHSSEAVIGEIYKEPLTVLLGSIHISFFMLPVMGSGISNGKYSIDCNVVKNTRTSLET